jgi:DegV family protein with EDD domain
MTRSVALVSDSTSIEAEFAADLDVVVVPLQVVIGPTSYEEGVDATPESVAAALRSWTPVSTSRPAPERFVRVYREAAAAGATSVVSIHLSSEVSGTVESALLAARRVDVEVEVVDSRQLGMGTGFAVASAARALDAGASAAEAAEVARRRSAATKTLFYVDTLEYLRRGGRVGFAAAVVGSALAVKPLLTVDDGRIVQLDKVRTTSRALGRLEELALHAAAGGSAHPRTVPSTSQGGDCCVDVAVSHLANVERAEVLAGRLRERIPNLGELVVNEVGAVIGAHAGPGMLAVIVAPRETGS